MSQVIPEYRRQDNIPALTCSWSRMAEFKESLEKAKKGDERTTINSLPQFDPTIYGHRLFLTRTPTFVKK